MNPTVGVDKLKQVSLYISCSALVRLHSETHCSASWGSGRTGRPSGDAWQAGHSHSAVIYYILNLCVL
jgi:hypothetical protein